jgi:NAD dependent epimerase/dehydratase family enzyme
VHRPTIFPVPARFAAGLRRDGRCHLHGQHVVARRLLEEGFRFAFADLGDALRDLVA